MASSDGGKQPELVNTDSPIMTAIFGPRALQLHPDTNEVPHAASWQKRVVEVQQYLPRKKCKRRNTGVG